MDFNFPEKKADLLLTCPKRIRVYFRMYMIGEVVLVPAVT